MPDGRLPAGSRTLVHTRASVAALVDTLLGQISERGLRRIAIAAAGDEIGKAVRAAAAARWRERGGTVVAEESLSLDVGDLGPRLRQIARAAPEAIVLGFRGPDLGELAARLREARYAGPLYVLDDDRAARLAAGSALDGAVVVTDAFVPEAGSAGQTFSDAYKKKYGQPPSRYAAQAYDAVAAIAEGIRRSLAERRGTPGGARLRESLGAASPSVRSIYGGPLALRDDGSLAAPLAVFTAAGADLTLVRHVAPAGRP
jgi:ABC-type branched-subunit amino acid transport system substrate-binding protein